MFFSFLSEYYLFYFNLHYIVYFSIFIYFYITFLMKRWITMKSNIALQISLHYSNTVQPSTTHFRWTSNVIVLITNQPRIEDERGQIDDHALIIHISKFIHLKEKSFSRSTQRGTNLNLLHEGLSVQIHRGRGRFRSRGRAEFRANSDWNVRNERQLSRNRSYRIFVFKLRGEGEGSRSIRPRQDIATKLFPRTAPRVLLLKRIGYIGNVIDAPPLLLLACGYPSGVDLEAIMDEIRGSSLDRWRPILKGTKNIKWFFEIFERVLQKFWNQISIGTS